MVDVTNLDGFMASRTRKQELVDANERDISCWREPLTHFADALTHPVFIKDRERRWILVNQSFADFFGLPRSQLVGRDHGSLEEPWARTLSRDDEAILASGTPQSAEMTLHCPQGERIVLVSKSRVIGLESGTPHIVGTIADLTEHRQLERALLEVADAERSRLGKTLHDEVGQKLTGVALLMRVLIDRLETTAPEEAKQAQKLSSTLRETIGNIRQLSRGFAILNTEHGNLQRAVEDLVAQIGSELALSCTLDCPEICIDDRPQIVVQLCRITRDALTLASRLARAAHAHLTVAQCNEHLTLTIEADGRHIAHGMLQAYDESLIMRERASLLGASIAIAPREGGGLRIALRVSS